MKRNFTSKDKIYAYLLCCAFLNTSCSSLWSHREKSIDASEKSSEKPKTVSKEQYDEIVRKYQELLDQKKASPVSVSTVEQVNVPSAVPVEKEIKPELAKETNIDPSELVNHIDQAVPDAKNVEGVDVLGGAPAKAEIAKAGPPMPDAIGVQNVNFTDDVDDQIVKLREAAELVKVNKFENALTILKELENSKEKQVVVRAKIMLGDLLFGQGEFDLALQVYEEVIKKYAFSGYVLKALGRLVACSEKLKQPEKQAKYYSLLHDFFEAT